MFVSKSNKFKEEYCASIVKIGEIFPIEGRDRIVKTLVNGLSIVIGKDEFKSGDYAVYVSNECVINKDFLYINSMFDQPELNKDPQRKGYINKYGRVRAIKLGGIPSYGILLNPYIISEYLNEDVNKIIEFLSKNEGEDFDELNGVDFCHVYIPPTVTSSNLPPKNNKKYKKLKKFNMLIEGSFHFHYDTSQLQKNIHLINPNDIVDISVKLHGTSAIFSNILTNIPTNWFKRMWRRFILRTDEYDKKYNLVYSSRTVIKNQYINKNQRDGGFYNDDVWGYWAKIIDGHLPEDVTIYCEIIGYTPNNTIIQKGYDYGCDSGKSKLMIYRVVKNNKELNISEVIEFGKDLKNKIGDGLIFDFPILYHGTLKDLYPDISIDTHWHENVLERLKIEKRFMMEMNEPLCINKVPREGFVLRKQDDPFAEAWKLKTDKFRLRETKQYDENYVDIEITESL